MSEMTIFNFKTETGVYNWCIQQAMTGNVEIWIVRVTTTQKQEKILMVVSDSWYEIDWQPGTEGPISNSDVFIASRAHIAHETLNRHQTILHNFFNFSSIERYHACHIFCKQISNEQKSQICVKCVIWKQIHEKWESVITESWPTFSNGRVRYWADPSYQPPSATEWPHYIMTNWPRVVPQKAHRCEDKKKSFDLPLLLGKASV